jgi:hypothetical protein
VGKTYMHVNIGDKEATSVRRTDTMKMETWTITLCETDIYLREEAFDDLLAKMLAAKADWDRRMEEAREQLRAERVNTQQKRQEEHSNG